MTLSRRKFSAEFKLRAVRQVEAGASSAVIILWVRTGGDFIQAAFVSIFLYFLGFWAFRRWLRSAPRTARPAKALVAPVAHAAPRSDLADEVAELRAARA